MLRVSYFVMCKSLKNEPGEKEPCLVGLMHVLSPKHIPSEYSFFVALGIMGADVTKVNTFKLIIKSPTDEQLAQTEVTTTPMTPDKITLPPDLAGYQAIIGFSNIEIPTEGLYKADIFINDELIETKLIPVVQNKGVN